MTPVPPLKEEVKVEAPPETTSEGLAESKEMDGKGTMVELAVPAAEAVLAALVTVQLKPTVPEAPAVKVMVRVPAPAVTVPLVRIQT